MYRLALHFVLPATVVLFAAAISPAQSPRPTPRPLDPPSMSGNDKSDPHPDFTVDPMEEMRTRMARKAEQKDYEENLARAREASNLGTQVLDAFKANKSIGTEEAKKLERIEKLTKKIRDEAGGQDSEVEELEIPNTLETAVKRVADLAGELRKDVEKTPRKVVSAVVIDRANNLIGLLRYVRKVFR